MSTMLNDAVAIESSASPTETAPLSLDVAVFTYFVPTLAMTSLDTPASFQNAALPWTYCEAPTVNTCPLAPPSVLIIFEFDPSRVPAMSIVSDDDPDVPLPLT